MKKYEMGLTTLLLLEPMESINFPETERIVSDLTMNEIFEPISVITDKPNDDDDDDDEAPMALKLLVQNCIMEGIPYRIICKEPKETWDIFIEKEYPPKASISIAIGNCILEGLMVFEPPFYVDTATPWSLIEIKENVGSFGCFSRCFVSLKTAYSLPIKSTNNNQGILEQVLLFLADKTPVFQIGTTRFIAVLEADENDTSESSRTFQFHIGYPHQVTEKGKSYEVRGDDLSSALFPAIDSKTVDELASRIRKYQKKSDQTKLESLLKQRERISSLFGNIKE